MKVNFQSDDWSARKLADVADITVGFAWKSAGFNGSSRGLPIIRIQNMGSNELAETVYWDGEFDSRYTVDQGDVLCSLSGSFKVDEWRGPKALLNQRIARLKPKPEFITREYLRLAVQQVFDELAHVAAGGTIKNADMKQLRELQFPVPPLAEQRRLVARIEALTSRVEQAREARRAALADAESVFVTVLRETFDALDEDENIQKPILRTVATIRTGYAFKSKDYRASGRLVFRVSNIRRDGSLNLEDPVYLAPELETEYNDYQLHAEDILMVMVGATVGKLCFIPESVLPALMNQNMWRFNPRDREALLPRYLFHYLLSTNLRDGMTLSESTHGHLKQGTYKEKLVPLPPLAEQRRIVTRLDALAAKQDDLRRLQTETEADLNSLIPAVLAKAFQGKM